MLKEQLIHVISAACRQLECKELYLVGSQAAYASLDHVPEAVLTSSEADFIPVHNPEQADRISGGMGEFTQFHKEFKYYAHGVELDEITLPADWKENLVDISFQDDITGKTLTVFCLSLYDLCASKLAAGRPKDFQFVKSILQEKHLTLYEIQDPINKIENDTQRKKALHNLGLVKKAQGSTN